QKVSCNLNPLALPPIVRISLPRSPLFTVLLQQLTNFRSPGIDARPEDASACMERPIEWLSPLSNPNVGVFEHTVFSIWIHRSGPQYCPRLHRCGYAHLPFTTSIPSAVHLYYHFMAPRHI